MSVKSVFFTAALLLLSGPLVCLGEGRIGFDATIEASSGIDGGANAGHALHSLALLHADWSHSAKEQPDAPLLDGYVSVLALNGRGPTDCFLRDFLAASNIEGYESVRLYSWWLEGSRNGWSLRGGALLADEEFAGTDAGGNFLNSAFGWPAFISANTVNTGPAFFVAAPGLRVAYTTSSGTTWRLGVYDGDSLDSPEGDPYPTRHGLHYKLGGSQGWFLMTEAVFAPADARTRITAGAWLHTADFADLRDDETGQPFVVTGKEPRRHASNHGVYAAVQRTLAGESGKTGNLDFFIRGGFSPSDRNAVGWAMDTGLAWTGPLPRRPDDVVALGLAHARFGSRLVQTARLAEPGNTAPDFEQVIELSYTAPLSEHLSVQPDIQWIRHPGGGPARRDAWVFLFRVNASY